MGEPDCNAVLLSADRVNSAQAPSRCKAHEVCRAFCPVQDEDLRAVALSVLSQLKSNRKKP